VSFRRGDFVRGILSVQPRFAMNPTTSKTAYSKFISYWKTKNVYSSAFCFSWHPPTANLLGRLIALAALKLQDWTLAGGRGFKSEL